jgi:hypothetical protein
METSDFFVHLKFKDRQLWAIREIYNKYFAPLIVEKYQGRAFICIWAPGIVWEPGKDNDRDHNHLGYVVPECSTDALWNEFSDLLPYMAMSASLTKLPAGEILAPHVDRKLRPSGIYFPISGCTTQCISKVYDYPLPDSKNSVTVHLTDYKFSYSIADNAVLSNPHLWHGVENFSDVERVAFGWNFRPIYSYNDSKKILKDLGYLNQDT